MTQILSFDTTTSACSVAIQAKQLYSLFEIAPRQHAERLLPMIELIMTQAELSWADLQAIAYCHGPGSFIGVRMATAVAQALGYAQQLPLLPISMLQTLAQQAWQKEGCQRVLAAWDARMNAIYWGAYVCDEAGIMQPVLADQLTPPAQVGQGLDRVETWAGAGNAWSVYQAQLPDELCMSLSAIFSDYYPTAEAMLAIAEQKFNQGETVSALQAQPLYLRDGVG